METGLKMNALFTICIQFLVESRIFQITSLSIEKIVSKSNTRYEIAICFTSFDLLRIAIRPFSNKSHVCAPAN